MSSKAAGYSPVASADWKSGKAAGFRRLLTHFDRSKAVAG
jgi:hypothetical protein